MEPAGDEAARRFVADLIRLRRDAGMPSYSTLERLSERRLSRSTMSDILTGKRVHLPDWRFVTAFVSTCRAAAEESDLDPAELGTPADWKRRWDTAVSGFPDASYPGRSGGVRSRHEDDEAASDASMRPGPPNVTPPSAHETALDRPEPAADQPAPAVLEPRAATGSPVVWGPVPRSAHDFVGREGALEKLYRSLAGDEGNGTVAIQGLAGIGKTQLAIAYADRHKDEYDLVWWVSGDTRESACAGMSLLDIAATSEMPEGERVTGMVEALRRGRPYARWLLIFDNAGDPDEIKDLMPSGTGHIIVTTRNSRWNAFEDLLELDVLARSESVTFLRRRIRGLTEVDAHRLAGAIGDLPLVLEHASESRTPVDEYLAQLDSAPRRLLSSNQPSGYPVPVAESWDAAIERLRVDAPSAMDLLRCCAFFGPSPIPLESLERGRYLPESALHTTLLDPILRSRAIGALGRTALARVSPVSRTIQIHRLVQAVVRDGLSEAEAERSRHDVHLLLAAADPGDPDDFDNWPRYEELRGHLDPSDAEGCRHATVRRLVLNMVRYLRVVGEPVAAQILADRALGRWPATDAGDVEALAMNLAINRSKVDALIALGSFAEAFELSRAMLAASSGAENVDTVVLGRSTGVELRMNGDFVRALASDEASMDAHMRIFGRDHPQTFMATNNLAIDRALSGQYEMAVQECERVYRDCLTFYGRNDHPAALVYQNAMARSLRHAGHYREALESAEQVREGYRSIIRRGILGEDHPWVLIHGNDLAAARRDAGGTNALSLASDVHNRCWRILGVDHPQTLATAMTLGGALRGTGHTAEARDVLTDAARRYASTLGADHPYTHACTAGLAATCRQDGAPATAIGLVETTLAGLRGTVGDDHHYTLIAMITHANTLADLGDPEAALAVGREALDGLERALGPDHPHTLACARNLSLVLSDLGSEDEAATLRADTLVRYQRVLSEKHPAVSLFLDHQRLDVDFSPAPI
jgi:tetratricopeptide (TPR) repeat protein